MSQPIEIFFAPAPDNWVEAVVMARKGPGPNAQQIGVAYRLLGARAMMDPVLCENWDAVVVCSPEFAKANRATPSRTRPDGIALRFEAVP